LALTAFKIGKLKIAAHVREELDRAGIKAYSINCKSGGMYTHRDTARVIVTVDGTPTHVDFEAQESSSARLSSLATCGVKLPDLSTALGGPRPNIGDGVSPLIGGQCEGRFSAASTARDPCSCELQLSPFRSAQ
jgi:hypothetical protein